jgi:hypothetical protein
MLNFLKINLLIKVAKKYFYNIQEALTDIFSNWVICPLESEDNHKNKVPSSGLIPSCIFFAHGKKNSKRWKNKKFISFSKLFHCSFHEKQFLFYIFLVVRRFSSLTLYIFFLLESGESDNIFNTCIMSSHLNLFKERREAFISFIPQHILQGEFLNNFYIFFFVGFLEERGRWSNAREGDFDFELF